MVFSHNSDLDGHLIVLPGGETAIQTVDGNVVLRLQLDKSGDAVLYGSPDGGATWPTSETVITNADLDTWVEKRIADNQLISANSFALIDTGIVIPSGKIFKFGGLTYTGNMYVHADNIYMDNNNRHIIVELANVSDSQVTTNFSIIRVCYGNSN